MKNKKAMSEVVTTVIMVVLALVAVAVIWQIINNLIGDKSAQISTTSKCLDVKLVIESVSGCSGGEGCNITVKRAAGGEALSGVKVVLKSLTESSKVIDIPTDIEQLGTVTLNATKVVGDGFNSSLTNKAEMTVYFKDESGEAQNCPSTVTYNL